MRGRSLAGKLTEVRVDHLPVSLNKLDISQNSVTQVGDLSKHRHLKVLNLKGNPLNAIMGLPQSIETVNIDSKIQKLGKECFHEKQCYEVIRSAIDPSGLVQPPEEVFNKGVAMVREYYAARLVNTSLGRYVLFILWN